MSFAKLILNSKKYLNSFLTINSNIKRLERENESLLSSDHNEASDTQDQVSDKSVECKIESLRDAFQSILDLHKCGVASPGVIDFTNMAYDLFEGSSVNNAKSYSNEVSKANDYLNTLNTTKSKAAEQIREAKDIANELLTMECEARVITAGYQDVLDRLFSSELENVILTSAFNELSKNLSANYDLTEIVVFPEHEFPKYAFRDTANFSYVEWENLLLKNPLCWNDKFDGIGPARKKQIECFLLSTYPNSTIAFLILFYQKATTSFGAYKGSNAVNINHALNKEHRDKLGLGISTAFKKAHLSIYDKYIEEFKLREKGLFSIPEPPQTECSYPPNIITEELMSIDNDYLFAIEETE